jgi:hypothetical protein
MNPEASSARHDPLGEASKLEAAVQRAVRAAVLAHARAGNPVSTWRDGQVVWVQPAEILARFANETATPIPKEEKR